MEYFTMIRKGIIKPTESTKNQCKFEGFDHYIYEINMAFGSLQQLNENGFIIDNTDVDLCICGLPLEGSCEQMHEKMLQAVKDLMKTKGADMIAYRASLYPYSTSQGNISFISKYWIADLEWGADQATLIALVK